GGPCWGGGRQGGGGRGGQEGGQERDAESAGPRSAPARVAGSHPDEGVGAGRHPQSHENKGAGSRRSLRKHCHDRTLRSRCAPARWLEGKGSGGYPVELPPGTGREPDPRAATKVTTRYAP